MGVSVSNWNTNLTLTRPLQRLYKMLANNGEIQYDYKNIMKRKGVLERYKQRENE
jgi:hypothetical protein